MPDEVEDLVGRLSLAQKVALLTGDSFWTLPGEPTIGLRPIVMSDGPVGVRGQRYDEREPSACLPTPSAVGATWDVDLARRLGALLGDEARAKGVDIVLAPTMNLQRDPRGGRNFENFSEDPVLAAELGCAVIDGIQSRGVAATAKHFVANDFETDRFTTDVGVDDVTLREVYLVPFREAVRTGAWLVMAAYNGVNGHTMTESPLLADVLKDEWGFPGAVVSDWFATRRLEAAGAGLLDVVMPGPSAVWGDALVAAVEDGSISEAGIDDKVLRLLRVAHFVGAIGAVPAPGAPEPLADVPVDLLREAAAQAMVLLRNEPIGGDAVLPLSGDVGSIAVIGELAEQTRILGGGSATVHAARSVTFADGLVDGAPTGCRVTLAGGVPADPAAVPIPVRQLAPVDGHDPGVLFTYLRADGTRLADELRRATVVQWPVEGSAGVPWTDIARIAGRAVLVPRRSGIHRIAVAAPGTTRLAVGQASVDGIAAPVADDTNGVAHRPPSEVALDVHLTAGEPVRIEFEHTPDDGCREQGGTLALTMRTADDDDAAIAASVAAAADHDVAIVVVGTGPSVESEGFDRCTLALPGRQDDLVRAIAAVNPRTVVVVNAGAPVLMPWVDEVAAVLVAWFPGQEAGDALADVVFGRAEPAGRLPMTWPSGDEPPTSVTPVDGRLEYAERDAVGYRSPAVAGDAAFGFGAGLGYTSWDVRATGCTVGDEVVAVDVAVHNVGGRPGRETVAVWAAAEPTSGQDRSGAARVVGFATIPAGPAATAEASIVVPLRRLHRWVTGEGWTAPSSPVELTVGPVAGEPVGAFVVDVAARTVLDPVRP